MNKTKLSHWFSILFCLITAVLFLIYSAIFSVPVFAEEADSIQTDELIVRFQRPLKNAANEVLNVYPYVKREIEDTFKQKIDFRPVVVIVRDREEFQKIIKSDAVVAFAVPRENLIVIDYSMMETYPFTVEATIKHELSHLFLHNYVKSGDLPKWLDEGISQWVSGGAAEIITGKNDNLLQQAVLSEKLISLKDLENTFPRDKRSFVLAYEESLSVVEFIDKEYGTDGILNIFGYLKKGYGIDLAVEKSLYVSVGELEEKWHDHIKRKFTWFLYLSNNLYTVIFTLAALLTLYGFIRLIIKKRAYKDEDEEDSTN